MSKHDDTSKHNMGIYWKDASRLRECKCAMHIRSRMTRKTMRIFAHFEVRDSISNLINYTASSARAEVDAASAGIMVKLL